MELNEHLHKSDIQIWDRVFDILEGDNMRQMQVAELQSLMLEVQQRLMSLRNSHAYVAKELDGQEHDNEFWRKVAASALADRDRANDRVTETESILRQLNALWDFSEPIKANEPITFDDPSAFNLLGERIKAYLE